MKLRITAKSAAKKVLSGVLVGFIGYRLQHLAPVQVLKDKAASWFTAGKAAKERDSRQKVIVKIAPKTYPRSLPLLGKKGIDSYGYPTQYVDVKGIRALLWFKRFKELTAYMETFQDAYEKDFRYEYWPFDAFRAFDSSEREMLPLLNEWVKASPQSFAPYHARATHLFAKSFAMRGDGWIKDVHPDNINLMKKAAKKAFKDIEYSLKFRANNPAIMRVKLMLLKLVGKREAVKQVTLKAMEVCPACYRIREAIVVRLTPRWGGSYSEMSDFIALHNVELNPMFRLLPGFIYLDKASTLNDEQFKADGIDLIDKACGLGEFHEFLAERAEAKRRLNDAQGALRDINRAIALKPNQGEYYYQRSYIQQLNKEYESGAHDFRTGIEFAPTNFRAREWLPFIVNNTIYEAWTQGKAKNATKAMELYDLAYELQPDNQDVSDRRFREYQNMDKKNAQNGKFEVIISMWNHYLELSPNDARAIFERSGAYYHFQDIQKSVGDLRRACQLKLDIACETEKQFR